MLSDFVISLTAETAENAEKIKEEGRRKGEREIERGDRANGPLFLLGFGNRGRFDGFF